MGNYRQLKVWQKAHKLVLEIYKVTNDFPANERFGMVSQLRRAAVSIPTNIAEGQGRIYKKEYLRFLSIARGSANELEYLIILSAELGNIKEDVARDLLLDLGEVAKMLNGLMKKIGFPST